MDTIKTTTHYEHQRFLPHAIDTRAERERTGVAKLKIVKRTNPITGEGAWVMQLCILFDDAQSADESYTLLLPVNWQNAADVLANTWPRVELLRPGQFDALVKGWRSAHEQKAGA